MTSSSPIARDTLLAVADDTHRWFQRQVSTSWTPAYLAQRRLDVVDCVGHAPAGWTGLVDHLRTLGYRDASIRDAGVAVTTQRGTLVDRFRDRVTLAVRDATGDVVGFVARKHPDNDDERAPRYVNSPASDLYRKGELLFGLAENAAAIQAGAAPVVVEGPFDALAVTEAGAGALVGVAPCGTALTPPQVTALSEVCLARPDARTFVAMDGDDAGRRAAEGAIALLTNAHLHPAAIAIPPNADPASLHAAGRLSDVLAGRPERTAAYSGAVAALSRVRADETADTRAAVLGRVSRMIAAAAPREVGDAVCQASRALGLPIEVVHGHVLEAVSPTWSIPMSRPRWR